MCDLASSSVKSSNALTAKSQKRSKKGKRGRSSTGSLTEALNVTRITTAGPAREVATSSQQKKHTDATLAKRVGETLKESRLGPCSLV